jgi:predicted glycosyltransferase involved in capsule biosynthesis
LALHDKDLYQENDAFLHHHDIVQLLDFQKTLNQVQFVPVNYKNNSKTEYNIQQKFNSTNFAANNCETFENVPSCLKLLPDADTCMFDDDAAGTSPFDVS